MPMASSAAGVTFGGFTCPVQTCFISFFYVVGAIFYATFSEDEFQSSWQVQHFGDHRHFAWQAQHFRGVALICVACFLRIALSGLPQVVTKCKYRGRRCVL